MSSRDVFREWHELRHKDPDLAVLVDSDPVVSGLYFAWTEAHDRKTRNPVGPWTTLEDGAAREIESALYGIRIAVADRIKSGAKK